jgi:hypothetical protein
MLSCGCKSENNEIAFCPVHQAAPEMLDALKTVRRWHDYGFVNELVIKLEKKPEQKL